ncbi:transcriptional repressor [Pseudodesulfovibrio sp. F-1]|uniref:Transcriptional repressor n=1 Tax=Pseudodesulfovibrio alkaliphilus TaxID=2661613 RepID=A0A7K1KPG3_9BACT|nr:Fur family transcriptional regulator [Pseudodesulfovibrio alkaliphilus]MUM77984.1 transcriptional repressor [Pseudodesulfovibrio alkaliphilus]
MPHADTANAARIFLTRTGIEPTLNRILVYSAMADSDQPLTAREILDKVLADHHINRVTVYRILDLLADSGAVNRIASVDGASRFCSRGGRWPAGHSHFHCTRCGEVRCVDNATLHLDETELGNALSMRVDNVDLRLDGICASCAEAARSDQAEKQPGQ